MIADLRIVFCDMKVNVKCRKVVPEQRKAVTFVNPELRLIFHQLSRYVDYTKRFSFKLGSFSLDIQPYENSLIKIDFFIYLRSRGNNELHELTTHVKFPLEIHFDMLSDLIMKFRQGLTANHWLEISLTKTDFETGRKQGKVLHIM